jgi:hypothetical protein
VDRDRSTALLYDAVHRGQAQTRSLAHFFRRKKRIKDLCLDGRAHTDPNVTNCQHHTGAGWGVCCFRDSAAIQFDIQRLDDQFTALGHGIAGVDREIHDDLFHLSAIRADPTQPGIEGENGLDILAEQMRQHLPEIIDHGIQVQDGRAQNLLAAECQHLLRQRRAPIGGVSDLSQVAIDLLRVSAAF